MSRHFFTHHVGATAAEFLHKAMEMLYIAIEFTDEDTQTVRTWT